MNKATLKNNLFVKFIYEKVVGRPIINVNSKNHSHNALLSYSVYPFRRKNRFKHPNIFESLTINKTLDLLGFNVDIYNNTDNRIIDYSKYDLIIGEGLPISNYFIRSKKRISTIYYATGTHPIVNNYNSTSRLIDFYNKSGIWVEESSRIVNNTWYLSASLSDYFIIIGNNTTKTSFEKFSTRPMFTINPPFFKSVFNLDFSRKRHNSFLWFGSYGLLHKGLDTVIETFAIRKNLKLHVCGYFEKEARFMNHYQKLLDASENIHLHGFIDIKSKEFITLMEECSFVILTSVAEGLATAVITAMGNGGLIPIITKETGIDASIGIDVMKNDVESLLNALDIAADFSKDEIISKSKALIEYTNNEFSCSDFENNLNRIFCEILQSEEI